VPARARGRVRLDYTGCLRDTVGPAGLTPDELAEAVRGADRGRTAFRRQVDSGRYGFDGILDDKTAIAGAIREGRRLARLADTLVVDGIGGSALGTLALATALRPRRRLVILDNVDPEGVDHRLKGLDPARTAVNVITKSGSTGETMANLLVLLAWSKKSGRDFVRRWCATTDPAKGDLLVLARRLGMSLQRVPENVGGRFSVLTAVGLVPAAFLGIDVGELLQGARRMREHCWTAPPEKNLGLVGAALLHALDTARGRRIQVLMPYADGLVHLADWYRQLWAESLGKRADRQGRIVETGQTPVTSLGATDQHSQVQLYMEGPHDKVVTFLQVEEFRKDIRIPRLHADLPSLGYLAGRTLGELLRAECRATQIALSEAGRPNFAYLVPRISADALGQLVYLFEFQTAIAGELYDIDAFDQPGVEAGKIATYALMGRKGYEEPARRLRERLKQPRAVI